MLTIGLINQPHQRGYETLITLLHNIFFKIYFRIDKLTESGLIVKWISDWIPKNTSCSNGPITESRRITTADLIGLLYIWLAGIGCSLLCFLAEILHVRFMHKYTIQVFTERHLK